VGENLMVGQILEKLVDKKGEACTMVGKRCLKPSSPNWKLWCVLDSKHNKCVPIARWLWCDAQGANRKINHIPNMIELVGKTPKTYDNPKTHKQ
jgi:hypothetical protein